MLKRIRKKTFSHAKTPAMKKLLENDSGEANYFSTVVFIFITVLLLAFIIDLFGIISTKQQLDHCRAAVLRRLYGAYDTQTSRKGRQDLVVKKQVEGALSNRITKYHHTDIQLSRYTSTDNCQPAKGHPTLNDVLWQTYNYLFFAHTTNVFRRKL